LVTHFLIAQAAQGRVVGWQSIAENDGVAISLLGMLIVFSALAVISLFIGALPKVLAALDPYLPEMHGSHGPPATQEEEKKVVAAIGMVLHLARQNSGPAN
jgi:oxaloacetate decarboxylase gamma subunit